MTYSEYVELRKESNKLLEFVDGVVYMSPSPSTRHQRISMQLSGELYNLLKGKDCEVIAAPYDVVLSNDEGEEKIVIPDLSVICDKTGFNDNQYIGVPSLIIEIVSPSNQSHDLVFKLNLYQKFRVKEYWIINPLQNYVSVYTLNEEGQYEILAMEKTGVITSKVIPSFTLNVDEVFK